MMKLVGIVMIGVAFWTTVSFLGYLFWSAVLP